MAHQNPLDRLKDTIMDKEARVFIRTPNGATKGIPMAQTYTFENLAAEIECIETKLGYNESPNQPGAKLLSCDFRGVKIFVKSPDEGKAFGIYVWPTDTLQQVKAIFLATKRIPPEHQRFYYAGQQLEEDKPLLDYNICLEGDQTLLLVLHGYGEMKLFIELPSIKTIELSVNRTESIESVKFKIEIETEGDIPHDKQSLRFAGKQLEDGKTLSDYNIRTQSTLRLFLHLRGGMAISVKTPTGRILDLPAAPTTTIENVKLQIKKYVGISQDRQCLIFDDKELEDHLLLSDYSINGGSILRLVVMSYYKIFIKPEAGTIFDLRAMENYRIDMVKFKIEREENIPKARQRLFYNYQELGDENTLSNFSIRENATLLLVLRPKNGIQIYVKMSNSASAKPQAFEVLLSDTIQILKYKIQGIVSLSTNNIFLTFNGKLLQDHTTFLDYEIHMKSILLAQFISNPNMNIHIERKDENQNEQKSENTVFKTEAIDTVRGLKLKVQTKIGIPIERQILTAPWLDGEQLKDDRTVGHYGIKDGSSIYLCEDYSTSAILYVTDPKGRVFVRVFAMKDSVLQTLRRIQEKEGFAGSHNILLAKSQ